jgi:hypothetical protein
MVAHLKARRARHCWTIGMLVIAGCGATHTEAPTPRLERSTPATTVVRPGDEPLPPYEEPVATTTPAHEPAELATRVKLDRKVPEVKYDMARFGDVIDYLRDFSGAEFFVNWKALQVAGIEKNTAVTARLFNVKASKALQVVLDSISTTNAEVGYSIVNGVINVTTVDELDSDVVKISYDIHDLCPLPGSGLQRIPNYKASAFGVISAVGAAVPNADIEPALDRSRLVEDLIQLIKETVSGNTWSKHWSIKECSGQLIVTQTKENQRQIAALIDQLRDFLSVQVTVDVWFLSIGRSPFDKLEHAATAAQHRKPGPDRSGIPLGPLEWSPPKQPEDYCTPASGVCLPTDQLDALLNDAEKAGLASVLAAPQVICFNGQQSYVQVGNTTPFVADWKEVRGIGGRTGVGPVPMKVETGLLLELRPWAGIDLSYARMELHVTLPKRYTSCASWLKLNSAELRPAAWRLANPRTKMGGW